MKPNGLLPTVSLLLVLLTTFHVTDDFVYGRDGMTLGGFLTVVLVVVVWLYGALVLAGRRWGYVITLLGSLIAFVIPFFHMTGSVNVAGSAIAQGSGAFFFVWTLLALGAAALFGVILSVHGLWSLRRSAPA